MGKMMKQVQKLQADMARVQEELAAARVEATAGGGVVRAVANGHGELVELHIDPAAVDPSDVGMLQDLVLAAVNDAIARSKDLEREQMASVAGGLGLPGMPGLR
jgi:DNA-binding YbaB/EbfC family protein